MTKSDLTPEQALEILADTLRLIVHVTHVQCPPTMEAASFCDRIKRAANDALERTAPFSDARGQVAMRSRIHDLIEVIRGLKAALADIVKLADSADRGAIKTRALDELTHLRTWVGF